MRKFIFTLLVCFLVIGGSNALLAQTETKTEDRPWFIAAKLNFIDYGRANGIDSLSITNGIEGNVIRKISDMFNIAGVGKVGVANVHNDINNRTVLSGDIIGQLKFLKNAKTFNPYVLGGAGVAWESEDGFNVQIPVGLGAHLMVGANSYITGQLEYRLSNVDNRNNIQLGIGYMYNIGLNGQDTDGDGVPDNTDACPDVPGKKELGGCPDRDGDGIQDAADHCPDDAGLVALNGCPDTDGDGIGDRNDACPKVKGLPELGGCPDSDGDGVSDREDLCPDEAGPVEAEGCPDRDEDGVFDKDDRCPDEAGPSSNYGCPIKDRDNDGIADDKDRCPDDAGPSITGGCPDRDNDQVADKDDRCPDDPGPYAGCPDTDGDGVVDADDACPTEAGLATNKGCPELKEEVKEVLNFAMRAVQFETGKATLKAESFAILDQIVDIMNQYPAYALSINGHTDNVGLEENNQILSEERAKSCFQYLVSKGVSAARLGYAGFGETVPLADNGTASGRKLNRRVEFNLYIK